MCWTRAFGLLPFRCVHMCLQDGPFTGGEVDEIYETESVEEGCSIFGPHVEVTGDHDPVASIRPEQWFQVF